MGTQRTSMKDVLAAINAQNETLAALVSAIAGPVTQAAHTPAPEVQVQVAAPAPTAQTQDTPRYEKGYMAHMKVKVAELVANDGQPRVLYGRVNKHGEDKLAYCLKERFSNLKDRGFRGAIEVFSA